MCHKLTILARDRANRIIAQGEHGTIHLYWTRAAIFLHPAELLPLIQCWKPDFDEARSEPFCIVRQLDGSLQLWYREIGVNLSECDLYDLAALLWHAAARLKLFGPEPLTPPSHPLATSRPVNGVLPRPEWRN